MMAKLKGDGFVSEENVYQEGIPSLLPSIDTILKDHLLPGSAINGFENLRSLLEIARKGEPSLLLVEHYSNFDLPAFHYLLRQYGSVGLEIAESFVAIAGIKLNESNPAVHAFARAYSRIVIFPSKYLELIKQNYKDPNKLLQEMRRSLAINHAAMRSLATLKTEGKIILVFPAGTRFRPWDPSSKRGVREIASYIKSFSKFCLVAINGNILRINPSGEMEDDLLHKDKLVYTVSPIIDSEKFLAEIKEEHHFRDDKKQEIVDHLMKKLETMHEEVERDRLSS
jgi:glycerol-3-phosphate O-acyltransferase